ncbi:hypothetical protein MLE16_004146 [Klebsiella oxytoca]|nr:hypothetical protein [Klebsiella oxytoca]
MKTRLLEVAGLNLKISLYNNVLVLSCNIDGQCNYETRRIISNAILSESEIFEKIDSEWVFKVFSKNIKHIINVLNSNVSIIPLVNHQVSSRNEITDTMSCQKLN